MARISPRAIVAFVSLASCAHPRADDSSLASATHALSIGEIANRERDQLRHRSACGQGRVISRADEPNASGGQLSLIPLPDGGALAIWVEHLRGGMRAFAAEAHGDTWSEPRLLMDARKNRWGVLGEIGLLRARRSSDGSSVVVVGAKSEIGQDGQLERALFLMRRTEDGAWSRPEELPVHTKRGIFDVLVDDQKDLHVIWEEDAVGEPNGIIASALHYGVRTRSGAWTHEERIRVPRLISILDERLAAIDGRLYIAGIAVQRGERGAPYPLGGTAYFVRENEEWTGPKLSNAKQSFSVRVVDPLLFVSFQGRSDEGLKIVLGTKPIENPSLLPEIAIPHEDALSHPFTSLAFGPGQAVYALVSLRSGLILARSGNGGTTEATCIAVPSTIPSPSTSTPSELSIAADRIDAIWWDHGLVGCTASLSSLAWSHPDRLIAPPGSSPVSVQQREIFRLVEEEGRRLEADGEIGPAVERYLYALEASAPNSSPTTARLRLEALERTDRDRFHTALFEGLAKPQISNSLGHASDLTRYLTDLDIRAADRPMPERAGEIDDLLEEAFALMVAFSALYDHPPPSACLSVGGADPSDALMKRFARRPSIKRASACGRPEPYKDSSPAIHYNVRHIRWYDEDAVSIVFTNHTARESLRYKKVRGRWIMREQKFIAYDVDIGTPHQPRE